MKRTPKLFSPAEIAKVEAYRTGRQTLWLSFVVSEISAHAQTMGPQLNAARQLLETTAADHVEPRFGGCLVRQTALDLLAVYANPVAAVLSTHYLHGRMAAQPIGAQGVRLQSGIDIGAVAPPRMAISEPVFLRTATRALQTLDYGRRGTIMVTEDVVRRLCGRLGDTVSFLNPEKRPLLIDDKESIVTLYQTDGHLLPATMPRQVDYPHAAIALFVRDSGTEQQYQFDADREGTIFLGAAPVCNVVLAVPEAAPHHARIFVDEMGSWVVDDAGSQSGTYHNQQLVRFGMQLKPGDVIQIGGAEVWVQYMTGLTRQS